MKNCFTYYPWSKRYYLLHPWYFFRDTWSNVRAAWQRATKGFAARDTWSLDDYFLQIIPDAVEYLSNHSCSYPGELNGFPEYEDWVKYLKEEIVEPLRNAHENQTVQVNEYEEELHSYPENFIKDENGNTTIQFTEPEELRKKWYQRLVEIQNWQQAELERGLAAMGKHFFSLWD